MNTKFLDLEIKDHLDICKRKSIGYIKQEFKENFGIFESKIKARSIDSLICKIIKQNKIQEFASYVNRIDLSL